MVGSVMTFVNESTILDSELSFYSTDNICDVAREMEEMYWRAGYSPEVRIQGIAAAVAPLVLEISHVHPGFYQSLRKPLQDWLVHQYGQGSQRVTEQILSLAVSKCDNSIPGRDQVREAMRSTGVVRVGSKNFWAQGVLYFLGGETPILSTMDEGLTDSFTIMLQRATHMDAPVHVRTKTITNTLILWAKDHNFKPTKELSIPVITPGSKGFGRNDVTIFRHNHAPLIVEIDSEPNHRTEPKLDFAKQAGGSPVWIRWHKEHPHSRPDLHVLNYADS